MVKQNILLADDDRLILATLSDGLRQAGYEVLEACNGEAALRLCKQTPPDLAVLDVNMPLMNGVEVAHYLSEQTSVPFIFLSAYGGDDIVGVAVEEGTQTYLVKPVDIEQLLPVVKTAIARSSDLKYMAEQETNLNNALNQSRETSMAVGLIMERYHLGQNDAFEALRYHARSQHRKLNEVAAEMLAAADTLNLPSAVLAKIKHS